MFPKHILIAGCCVALLSLSALAQSSKLSPRDKEFLKMAAITNMTEAHLGQMAEGQASGSGVKDFGQALAKDHTKAYEELTALDGKLGQTIPKGINVRRDKTIERLADLKGRRFDRQFLRAEVQDHERAIAAFKREARHGQDQELKSYASQTLPTMEEHLRNAEKLLKHRA
jgi:putative membrane protein